MYCKECGEKVDDAEAHDAISDHPFVKAVPDQVEDPSGDFWWDRLPWLIKVPISPFVFVGLILLNLTQGLLLILVPLLQGVLLVVLLIWAAIKLPWITDWNETFRRHRYTKKDKYRASFM